MWLKKSPTLPIPPNRAVERSRPVRLQWHITERCDRRCLHCYQEEAPHDELPLNDLVGLADQYIALLDEWGEAEGVDRPVGHITVTGGEPFIRPDFFTLLEAFAERRSRFGFAILTNGSFIDDDVATRLAQLGPSYVQLSLEGGESLNDALRGRGAFAATAKAVKGLGKKRISVSLSFTAHAKNYRCFGDVVRQGCAWGVDAVWTDRLIPCGAGVGLTPMTSEQTEEYVGIVARERRRVARNPFVRTVVKSDRALQFLHAGRKPYHCHAGASLLTLSANGDLLPCRRMPIRVGNVTETPLKDLYFTSPILQKLRGETVIAGCEGCHFTALCRGGLKCLSYAVNGDPFTADPGCWIAGASNSRDVTREE